MRPRIADRSNNMKRLLEGGAVFAGKSDHDVGGQGQIGDFFFRGAAAIQIKLLIVRAVHRGENAAVPALQRNMQVAAQFRFGGESVQQAIRDLSRLD